MLGLGMLLWMLATGHTRAQIAPIAIESSSFTGDAVYEGENSAVSIDLSGDSDMDGYFLVTHDYAAANPGLGFDPNDVLPQDGTLTNPANGAVFEFQPYDQPNVVVVSGDATLDLAPSAQATYSELSFLVTNLQLFHTQPFSITLNFTDGNTLDESSSGNVPNWMSADAPVGGGIAATLQPVLYMGAAYQADVQFDEYDFNVDTSETLESITVHGGNNQLDLYAVSGIDPVGEAPEPRAWALLLGGFGALLFTAQMRKARI
jgi:hypothetical protein